MAEDSIFTKIIKGELPCHKVYEDGSALAFLDIHPAQQGQVLVVSKRQVEDFYDLPDDEYQALMAAAKKVAYKLRQHFPQMRRIAMVIEGLDVPHAHVKLFPINTADDLRRIPDMNEEPDHTALSALAQSLYME